MIKTKTYDNLTKASRTKLCKRITQRMTDISLNVCIVNADIGISTYNMYRESVIAYREGELDIFGSNNMGYDRIKIGCIASIKEFEIKKYDILLTGGTWVRLEEYLY